MGITVRRRSPRRLTGQLRRTTRPWTDRGHSRSREHGFATAEFAAVVPAVVLLLVFVVTLHQAVLLRHQAVLGASVAARVLARGETEGAARRAAQAVTPPSARIAVHKSPDLVEVQVALEVPGPAGWILPPISEQVSSVVEQIDPDLAPEHPSRQPGAAR